LDRGAVLALENLRRDLATAESGDLDAAGQAARNFFALVPNPFGRHRDRQPSRPGAGFLDGDLEIGGREGHTPGCTGDAMRKGGLEPPRACLRDPKSRESTDSATFAILPKNLTARRR